MEKHKKESMWKCIIILEIVAIIIIAVMMMVGIVTFFIESFRLPEPPLPSIRSVQINTFPNEEKFITQKEVEPVEINGRILFGKVVVKWTNKKTEDEEIIAVLAVPYQEIPLGTKIEVSSVEFLPNRMMPAYFYIFSKMHE